MTILNVNYARIKAIIGLDFHVLVTLLFRGWTIVAGGTTVFLLPVWLSPAAQGYYFTFASVLALQIFFELGLNQIVMQMVSYEVAHLTAAEDGRLSGPSSHLGRLSSLAVLMNRWYGAAAISFALIGGIAGFAFFSKTGTEPMSVWLAVWIVLIISTAVNLRLSPGLAVMEGCGKVGQVARLRLVQSVIGYLLFWILLMAGAGLWAATAVPTVSAMCTGYWLKNEGSMLRWLVGRPADIDNKLSWRTDVLPLQWRIAVSWMSGYLIFNLFTPVVFSRQGAAEAGRLGLALAVFSALSTVGMSWINAKAPNFTMHIARGERKELNSLFKAVFFRSTFTISLISVFFVFLVWCATKLGISQVHRIASLDVLAILVIVTIANSIVYALAVYMRAHREEPMLPHSVTVGALVACAVYFGSTYGVLFMMTSYMAIVLTIALPWATWLFAKYLRKSL